MQAQAHLFLGNYEILGMAQASSLVFCAAHWSEERIHSRGLDPYECFLELTPRELAKINPLLLSHNKQISRVT